MNAPAVTVRFPVPPLLPMQHSANIPNNRRGCLRATMLLVLFATLLFGPVAASVFAQGEATLPACCRSHGQHHCAMARGMAEQADGSPRVARVTEKCPCTPGAPVNAHRDPMGGPWAEVGFAITLRSGATAARTTSRVGLCRVRDNGQRGPPSSALAL